LLKKYISFLVFIVSEKILYIYLTKPHQISIFLHIF
jgi:hypothetical protein